MYWPWLTFAELPCTKWFCHVNWVNVIYTRLTIRFQGRTKSNPFASVILFCSCSNCNFNFNVLGFTEFMCTVIMCPKLLQSCLVRTTVTNRSGFCRALSWFMGHDNGVFFSSVETLSSLYALQSFNPLNPALLSNSTHIPEALRAICGSPRKIFLLLWEVINYYNISPNIFSSYYTILDSSFFIFST